MKILHLHLHKKWFDLILSGKKTEEYRERKPYWESRFLDKQGSFKHFDIVRFKNGYGNVASIDVELKEIGFIKCRFIAKNGEKFSPGDFMLKLGKILRF